MRLKRLRRAEMWRRIQKIPKALAAPGMIELIHAARVDGAGFFRQWWTVRLPVLRPGLAFLGIFTFFHVWNDYLWPLIVMTDPGKVTLQVAVQQLNGVYTTDQSMVITGALLSVIPLIGVFLIGARHFIANLGAGAMKF